MSCTCQDRPVLYSIHLHTFRDVLFQIRNKSKIRWYKVCFIFRTKHFSISSLNFTNISSNYFTGCSWHVIQIQLFLNVFQISILDLCSIFLYFMPDVISKIQRSLVLATYKIDMYHILGILAAIRNHSWQNTRISIVIFVKTMPYFASKRVSVFQAPMMNFGNMAISWSQQYLA